MLEGEAVRPLTILFLEMWSILREPEFEKFLSVPPHSVPAKGFAAPYGDCPLDGERVGEMVYIDLLNRAKRYIHIMTPTSSSTVSWKRPQVRGRAGRGRPPHPAPCAG